MPKFFVTESGEILEVIEENDVFIKMSHGDRIVRKKSLDYFSDTKDLKKRFIKVNDQAVFILNKYGKYICILLRFVGYLDGILKFNNGIYLNNNTISKIFNVNLRNTIKILNELLKEDIIHKHKIKNKNYYTFNPWIASRGKRVSIELYDDFKLSEWASKSQDALDYETYGDGK